MVNYLYQDDPYYLLVTLIYLNAVLINLNFMMFKSFHTKCIQTSVELMF